MEEVVNERDELPAFLYAQLVRQRALLHRLAAKHFVDPKSAVDVTIDAFEDPNRWLMTFTGMAANCDRFRVSMEMYKRGRSRWMMLEPRVFVNDVEDTDFEGGLEEALAAALGGSGDRVGETQGSPAVNSRGARSNAVETRRAVVIRN